MTTVTGKVQIVNATAPVKCSVRFELKNYGDSIPRIISTNIIIDKTKFEVLCDNVGNFTASLYDNALINPAGTYYHITFFQDGEKATENDWLITGTTIDLDTATPITTPPVVVAPTGDATYLRLDSGNINLWVGDKGIQVFNVKAYGAKGDGVTNDSPAINVARIASVNGILYFPPGAYLLGSPIVFTGRCIVMGAGTDLAAGSIIISSYGNSDMFLANQGAQGIKFRDLAFIGQGIQTSGAAIRFNFTSSIDGSGASPGEVSDCVVNNVFTGFQVDNGNQITFNRCFTAACLNDGLKITGGLAVFVNHCNFLGSINIGIEVTSVAGLWLTSVQVFGGLHSFVMSGGAQVFASDCIFDVPSGDCIQISTAGGQIEFTGCWASGSSAGMGIDIQNTVGFEWSDGWIRANFLDGVRIHANAHRVSIKNARISDNGHNNGTKRKGIRVDANTTQFQIIGNQIGVDDGDTANEQDVGILIAVGTSNYYIISLNLNTDPVNQTLVTDGGTGVNKFVGNNVT